MWSSSLWLIKGFRLFNFSKVPPGFEYFQAIFFVSMNVPFSCKVFPRCARRVGVFSRMSKFSRIVIYRANLRISGLEWGDLPILFNRNNSSSSVGVFSFSLIWESIVAQFLTLVPPESKLLVEKDSPSSRTKKSSCFSRLPHFGNVSPFLVSVANTFSDLIHPLIKLPNCVLKFYNIFTRSARLFQLTPPSRSRHRLCWRSATSTHFWSSTLYTTFHREAMLMLGFFSSPHTLYGRVRLARFALKTLTSRFTDFFTDFEKKTDCFAVYWKEHFSQFLSEKDV